ncbi:Gfo/Idh/MocA family oxidoreductase [Agromyces sp. G08B096]|uniref:Gfo/Idh/MocA family oxidoreductase n=1 Tax=Agromyces sp. G08B096 TaxID=3156399 RepID=A0AAU7W326_9MICO
MTRWAILGTGMISHQLVPDLQTVFGDDSVIVVWGRDETRTSVFAGRYGIASATTDMAEVLRRDEVDAVYIATPIATHATIALEAISAGKHVLIEKPMASSAAEIAQIFDAADASGVFAMEAMWMKCNPLHVDLLQRVKAGLTGEPRSISATFGMPTPPTGRVWTTERGDSAVLDRGIYAVTLAQWVLGEPVEVHASGVVADGIDVEARATLIFANGSRADIGCSAIGFLDQSATISGTLGWITIEPMFWASTIGRVHAGSAEAILHSPGRVEHPREGSGFRPMLRAVADALAAGERRVAAHDRAATLAVARTLDVIREQVFDSHGRHAAAG